MTATRAGRWPAAVAGGLILLILGMSFLWPAAKVGMLSSRAGTIAGGDACCRFDGRWHNGMPVARIVPEGWEAVSLWSDVRDRFLVADMASPFHFGVVVLRPGEEVSLRAEVWGWSWRSLDFWLVEGNEFDLACFGDLLADCVPTSTTT